MTWITVSFSNVAIGARHQWRQNLYKDDTAVSNADVAKANNIYREKMQKNMQKSIQTEMKDMVRFIFSLLLLLSITVTAFAAPGQSVYGRLHVANVMYACHFYADTHGQWLRDKVQAAENKGAAIFVSEWGTSAADGNGGVFLEATNQWLDFLSQEQISWANWSLCDEKNITPTQNYMNH